MYWSMEESSLCTCLMFLYQTRRRHTLCTRGCRGRIYCVRNVPGMFVVSHLVTAVDYVNIYTKLRASFLVKKRHTSAKSTPQKQRASSVKKKKKPTSISGLAAAAAAAVPLCRCAVMLCLSPVCSVDVVRDPRCIAVHNLAQRAAFSF